MNITIPTDAITSGFQAAAESAIGRAFNDYAIAQQMGDQVKDAIEQANVPSLLGQAVTAHLDTYIETIVQEAVAASTPALRAALTSSVQMLTARMLYGMRNGPNSYMSAEEKQAWNECVALAKGQPPLT